MKSLNKILSGVLAVAMLATSVNMGFAASNNFSDVNDDIKDSVAKLTSVGVIQGYEDGTFRPDNTITRAEAAAIMVRMLGKEDAEEYSRGMTQFSDSNEHWGAGYINIATSEGIIKGYPDGTFKPNNKVSYAEMITMMVRAIGAGEAVGARGTWPDNYIMFASAQDLTDGVGFSKTAPASRGNVAKIAENTLEATLWEIAGYNTDGTLEIKESDDENETLLREKLEITKNEGYTITSKLGEGTLDTNEFKAGKDLDKEKDGIQEDEEKTFEFAKGIEKAVVEGEVVDIWENDDDEVVLVIQDEDSDQDLIRVTDVTEIGASSIEVQRADGKTKEYDLAKTVNYKLNGKDAAKADLDEDKNYIGTILLNDDDDVTDIKLVEFSKGMIVKEVEYDEKDNEIKIRANKDMQKSTNTLSYELDDEVVTAYDAKGNEIDAKSVKEGDLVLYAGDHNEYLQILKAEKVEGTVEGEDKDEIEVDGKEYSYNENFRGTNLVDDIDVDDDVVIYLDGQENIVMLEKTAGSSKAGEYGVITRFYSYNDVEEGEQVAKIELFDLESGEKTGRKEFDAEETDDQGTVFTGESFFDGTDAKTDAELAGTYQGYVGKVVKYDIKDGKIVIYKVDNDEIRRDATGNADLDVSKGKFSLSTGNYYVEEGNVKVYQATELDDKSLQIKTLDYEDLKDNKNMNNVVLTELDSDEEVAEYVFFPLNGENKQELAKSNDDNVGIITKVRILSGEDIEVKVLTNDGEQKFYVEKDDSKEIATKSLKDEAIKLNDEDHLEKFEGLLVAYSANSEGYVENDNIQFSNKIQKAKLYEINDRDEVQMLNESNTKFEKDAYENLVVAEADIKTSDAGNVLDNIDSSEVSKISEVDEDVTNYEEAGNDEADTVMYYLVEIDDDGEIVDLDGSDATGDNSGAIGAMIFDPSEY